MILVKRQVNPAAFSGVTDQISNAGSAAGSKAADATSGLSRVQLSVLIVCIVVGLVAGVAALFWLCSCSRRRKRAREMRERSDMFKSTPTSERMPAYIAAPVDKRPWSNGGYGESSVALNPSNARYGHGNAYGQPARPVPAQQSYRF